MHVTIIRFKIKDTANNFEDLSEPISSYIKVSNYYPKS